MCYTQYSLKVFVRSHRAMQGHKLDLLNKHSSISILWFKMTHANFLEDRRRVSHKLSFLTDKSSCLTSLPIPMVMFNSSSFETLAGSMFKFEGKYSSGHLDSLKNNLAPSLPKDNNDKPTLNVVTNLCT